MAKRLKFKKPKINWNFSFAFRNFRNISFEWKIIFVANLVIVFSCILPWVSLSDDYSTAMHYSAFSGETRIIGILVFILSLLNSYFFIDKIFDLNKLASFKKKYNNVSENYIFLISAAEQLLLLTINWFIVKQISINYNIEFGFFLVFITEIIQLAAAILAIKDEKHQQAKSFFSYPDVENKKQINLISDNNDNKDE